jgi:hypothetical protein
MEVHHHQTLEAIGLGNVSPVMPFQPDGRGLHQRREFSLHFLKGGL